MTITTEPICLSHRGRVEALREKYGHTTSSHAFSTLYIWRKDMELSLYFGHEFFAVKSTFLGELRWFFPCGDRESALPFVTQLLEQGNTLCYMTQSDVDFLTARLGDSVQYTPTWGDSEYLYDRDQQEKLAGRRFMRIRNDINRGRREHEFSYFPLTAENLHIARAIHDTWVETRAVDTLVSRQAGYALLAHYEALDVQGGLGYLDGEPCVVVAGYPLSSNVFDLSLSNQTLRLSGIAPWTRQCLVASLPPQYTVLNAEEDLDIPGLRQMKQIMRPSDMIPLFKGRLGR